MMKPKCYIRLLTSQCPMICRRNRLKLSKKGTKNWVVSESLWSKIISSLSRFTSLMRALRTRRKNGSSFLWTLFRRYNQGIGSMQSSGCRSIIYRMLAFAKVSMKAFKKSTAKTWEVKFGKWSARCTVQNRSTSEGSFRSLLSKRTFVSRVK